MGATYQPIVQIVPISFDEFSRAITEFCGPFAGVKNFAIPVTSPSQKSYLIQLVPGIPQRLWKIGFVLRCSISGTFLQKLAVYPQT